MKALWQKCLEMVFEALWNNDFLQGFAVVEGVLANDGKGFPKFDLI